jgi:antitoxin YefM
MRVTSYSDLRRNLAAALDRVAADREPLIITRHRRKPTAVLMSLEEFASYEETQHLLRSPANARRPLSGWGSRRLTQEHRLVYQATEDGLLIAQCRYHY